MDIKLFDYEDTHTVEADQFNQTAWAEISENSNAVRGLVKQGEIAVGDQFAGLVDDGPAGPRQSW